MTLQGLSCTQEVPNFTSTCPIGCVPGAAVDYEAVSWPTPDGAMRVLAFRNIRLLATLAGWCGTPWSPPCAASYCELTLRTMA